MVEDGGPKVVANIGVEVEENTVENIREYI